MAEKAVASRCAACHSGATRSIHHAREIFLAVVVLCGGVALGRGNDAASIAMTKQ